MASTIAIRVRRRLSSPRGGIYAAFVDGSVFRLTGATSIHCDGRVGGSFELLFEGRGAVRGRFLELSQDHRVCLAWKVSGFGRPDETTLVDVTISEGDGQSVVGSRSTFSSLLHPRRSARQHRRSSWSAILAPCRCACSARWRSN
jgi:uncharacterized protein YndB with AHSA1/START domain